MRKKRIGILGSGVVAQALTEGFLAYGYEVMLGSRNPEKLDEFIVEKGKGAKTGNFDETAAYGEILVLAIKGDATKEALEQAGIENLSDKTIVDAANPIANAAPENGVLKFFTDLDFSLMEDLQQTFPEANFVKAFNSVGSVFMVNPDFESKPTMFICGNNEMAKKEVTEILELFGWEAEDMGGAEAARAIEPLCMLWCIPGFRENKWSHTFKLMKK